MNGGSGLGGTACGDGGLAAHGMDTAGDAAEVGLGNIIQLGDEFGLLARGEDDGPRGLSVLAVDEIAGLVGTNKAGINDIKSGKKKVQLENLRRLKKSYPQVSLAWIITGDGQMMDGDVSAPPSTGGEMSTDSGGDLAVEVARLRAERDALMGEKVRLMELIIGLQRRRLEGGADG